MKHRRRALRGRVSLYAPPPPPPRELSEWERQQIALYEAMMAAMKPVVEWAERMTRATQAAALAFLNGFREAVREDYVRAGEPFGPDDSAMWRWFGLAFGASLGNRRTQP